MTTRHVWRSAALLLVLVTIGVGCGGGDSSPDPLDAGAEEPTSEPADTTPEATPAPTTPSEPDVTTIDPADGPTETAVVSALGGIRFAYPADMAYLSLEDVVLVHPVGASPNEQAISLHLVTQLTSGAEVSDLDTYFEAIEASHDVEPTGTSISVLGYQLDGFDVTGSVDAQLFGNSRHPAPVQAAGGPGTGLSKLFVGITPSGILTVGANGETAEAAEAMLPALGTLLDSLELTGPGLDPPLPPGESIEPADAGPPPPPAEASEDATLPALGAPFSPAEPGRHELLNFGLAVSVDFDDNWFVQPNFPGVVVLTHPESIGPNDRDVVFINSIAELVPIAGGPIRAGAPVDVSDIELFLESPPEGVEVSRLERVELAAPDGTTTPVVVFDLAVDADSDCSPADPCEVAFVTTYGFVKSIRPTDTVRVWWFPEHPHGPAAAVAAGPVAWLPEAERLMATLELSR